MVRLHLLGFTHDLKGVVFGRRKGGKTASFWVPIDDGFLGAVAKLEQARKEQARPVPAQGATRGVVDHADIAEKPRSRALPPVGRSQPRSGMPAAEIQQMLREGKSIKTVAAAAKTQLAWVERLAEPVLTERMGVVRLAQRAYMSRARLGMSGLQLGDAVRRNLEERRATVDNLDLDATWDARATAAGGWRVWVRFSHRGRRWSAEWDFKKGSRTIYPRNRLAAQIGWWAPEAPVEAEPASGDEDEGDEGATEVKKSAKKAPQRKGRPVRKRPAKAKARPRKKPVRRRR